MKFSKKNLSLLFGCIACSAVLSAAGSSLSHAAENTVPISEPIRIYGSLHVENGRVSMTDVHGDTTIDELILNISEETRILDAVNGFPVSIHDLKDGEAVYAYISHAMAMSLPPQSHAFMIICQIPADFTAPSLETADSLAQNADGSVTLKTMRNEEYRIDAATSFLPYLTRNIVTVNDLTKGRTCLIWRTPMMNGQAAGSATASKIVIFPDSEDGGNGSGNSRVSGPASDPELLARVK